MSRICLVALALCFSSAAWAAEPEQDQQDYVAPQYNFRPMDRFAAPQPSGLRFSGASGIQVRTGSVSGGLANGMGGGCNTCGGGCGGNGYSCIDWTYLPWYGSWGDHGCGRRNGCNNGCDNCYSTGFGHGY